MSKSKFLRATEWMNVVTQYNLEHPAPGERESVQGSYITEDLRDWAKYRLMNPKAALKALDRLDEHTAQLLDSFPDDEKFGELKAYLQQMREAIAAERK